MKYLGPHGCWKYIAYSCLKHAIKEGDIEFAVNNPKLFYALCDILDTDELEVLVALRRVRDRIDRSKL